MSIKLGYGFFSAMVICYKGSRMLDVIANLGNRNLTGVDEKMKENILAVHQLNQNLLLLQLKVNSNCDQKSQNGDTTQG